jgi:hypothetical protein
MVRGKRARVCHTWEHRILQQGSGSGVEKEVLSQYLNSHQLRGRGFYRSGGADLKLICGADWVAGRGCKLNNDGLGL